MIEIILLFLLLSYTLLNVIITFFSIVFGYDELFPEGFDWDGVVSILTMMIFGSIILLVDRWVESDEVISKREFEEALREIEKKYNKSESK